MSDLDAIGEVDVLTAELIDTARACRPGKGEAKRYVFLTRDGKKQGEAVRIGKRLYEIGGTTAMQMARDGVADAGYADDAAQLDLVWDGIGEWVA